jgi:predicted aspartyl protease
VPRSGGLTAQTWRARDCVRNAYEGQRTRWLSRLSGAAYEEATRPAERHVELQRGLGVLGFLPSAVQANGVYGAPTRNAVMAWQSGHGRTATGFIGEDDARAIQREASNAVDPNHLPRLAPPGPRDEIPLSRRKGIFVVPGLINETITLGFILDSGAADVQIPIDVVMTLACAGTISDGDFVGTQTYTMADGSTLKGDQFMLRQLRLGTHAVRNVLASIGPPKGDLLLGQSFLSRFGTWAIDNARSVLILQAANAEQPGLSGAPR